jgi:hypothetical protein
MPAGIVAKTNARRKAKPPNTRGGACLLFLRSASAGSEKQYTESTTCCPIHVQHDPILTVKEAKVREEAESKQVLR